MFKWNETYALGITEIDEQHQMLFKIGGDLYQLLNAKDQSISLDEMNAILAALQDYAAYHFKTEEDYFEAFHYEHKAAHEAEHADFIQKLKALELGQGQENELRQAMGTLKLLIDWVFKHIHGSDFQYRACFELNLAKGKCSV